MVGGFCGWGVFGFGSVRRGVDITQSFFTHFLKIHSLIHAEYDYDYILCKCALLSQPLTVFFE